MARKTIITIAIIAIILLTIVIYFVLRETSPTTSPGGGSQGTSGSLPLVATGTASFPSGTTFNIGTSQGSVTVNNFYKTNAYITQDQQTVVLVENTNYTIVYNRDDSGFVIGLLSGSLQETRDAAETAFLSQLGISKSEACKLTVDERVLDKASPYDGQLMGLSFCSGDL